MVSERGERRVVRDRLTARQILANHDLQPGSVGAGPRRQHVNAQEGGDRMRTQIEDPQGGKLGRQVCRPTGGIQAMEEPQTGEADQLDLGAEVLSRQLREQALLIGLEGS